jgi:hypothetical protein
MPWSSSFGCGLPALIEPERLCLVAHGLVLQDAVVTAIWVCNLGLVQVIYV